MILSQKLQHCCSGAQWIQFGAKSHTGINLPLSALTTQKSCGIGEFLDLIPLLTFCSQINMDVIQLLPLNDSGLDSSPYNALSSLALHPIYLSLQALPHLDDPLLLEEIRHLGKLNQTKRIEWSKVLQAKMEILFRYFTLYGQKIVDSSDYQSFLKTNPWIKPYALFKVF